MSDDTDDVPDEFPVTSADKARQKYENRPVDDNRKYNDARNARRKAERIKKKEIKARMAEDPDYVPPPRKKAAQPSEKQITFEWDLQLRILERRTRGNATDADGDIDFAYRNMALSNVVPKMAPSLPAWQWYVFARSEPNEFLKICHRREDAKSRQAGTITSQRMEDDKRQQFAVIDRLERALTLNVKSTVTELMQKFPRDVLDVCSSFRTEWDAYIAMKNTAVNE